MSRDSLVKWGLIALLATASVLIIAIKGLTFPLDHCARPLLVCGAMISVAVFYARRSVEQFVISAHALAQIVAFSACYSVAMYCVASFNSPLADDWLVSFDKACGVCVADVAAWAANVPKLSGLLQIAYATMLIQTALVVISLGFANRRQHLESFVLCFMVSSTLALAVFAFLPAEGPFCSYGYEPDASQQRFLDDFHAMRSGERTLVTWKKAEGLITFPSFHTTWALLLAWGLRGSRFLFIPACLLNLAVVASTMTTGWHYFADVLSGTTLAAGTVLAAGRVNLWLYQPDGSPKRVGVPASPWPQQSPPAIPQPAYGTSS